MWERKTGVFTVLLAGSLLSASCGPPQRPGATGADAAPVAKTRLVAVMNGDPPTLSPEINRASLAFSVPGDGELRGLILVGLTLPDADGDRRPVLSENVPTTDNGLWTVLPDGRMETRWTLRADALWHDGTPVTAEDFLFTAKVERDRDLAVFRNIAYNSFEDIGAPDPRTVLVKWSRPYIDADAMFQAPLPKHLLEQAYLEDKGSFLQLPYWADEFVGTGPFRLKELVRGSHVVLEANERYIFGRPRIDEIEVKFIPDTNTLIANLLAGSVSLTLGRSLNIEQAIEARDQWRDGDLQMADLSSWVVMYPQMLTPNPAIVADARFRRALLHAIDRQQLADTLQGGLVPVAHSYIGPDQPEYRATETRIVRYEYDPRRAVQTLERLGYSRGPDGVLRDTANQRLSLEIRVTARNQLSNKTMFAVADFWRGIGVAVDPVVIATQRVSDQEYLHTYPAFMFYRQSHSVSSTRNHHSSQAPLPETNFVGRNYARYTNVEFDSLIDKLFTTIPMQQRLEVLGDIVHHVSDQLNIVGLFYDGQPVMIGRQVRNVTPRSQGWNAHEWEVR